VVFVISDVCYDLRLLIFCYYCRENIGEITLLATNRDAKCPKVREYTFFVSMHYMVHLQAALAKLYKIYTLWSIILSCNSWGVTTLDVLKCSFMQVDMYGALVNFGRA